jgi:pyruvate dehydrogenase E2 component (dihydrolipoamide acetyltransferase)
MAIEPSRIFVLPDLGEGLPDAEIVAWHVAEGDHVVADQPLVSVETDKAVVEIPSPRAGRIARLLAVQHARLPIGAPLVAFTDGIEHDSGTVVGELAEAAPAPAVRPAVRPRAAPAVRALAASLGIDLASITGSGPQSEITRADVERAAGKSADMEPLHGVRRSMALRMAEAGSQVVPATLTDEADVDAWPAHTPVPARLVAALVAACRAEPALNAAYDGKALARRLNAEIHVGIAVDTEDGLLVPVLRNAEQLDLAAIDLALQGLETAVKARQVAPDSLRGATISLSNFGSLGGRFAALVVVPPQVAILGTGRIERRAVVRGDGIVARRILPMSLSFDHRAISGGEAARFLAAAKAALENPP